MLRQQTTVADSIYLDGFSPSANPGIWDAHTLKALARHCRRGTQLATWTIARAVRDQLAQCGFEVRKVPGVPPSATTCRPASTRPGNRACAPRRVHPRWPKPARPWWWVPAWPAVPPPTAWRCVAGRCRCW
jgi:tRNA 5-methylaminomethyl-2-thiouridine biosynthesis bifunctional protein